MAKQARGGTQARAQKEKKQPDKKQAGTAPKGPLTNRKQYRLYKYIPEEERPAYNKVRVALIKTW